MRFLAVTLFGLYGVSNSSYVGYESGTVELGEPPKYRGSRIGTTRGTFGGAGGSSRSSSPVYVMTPPSRDEFGLKTRDAVLALRQSAAEHLNRLRGTRELEELRKEMAVKKIPIDLQEARLGLKRALEKSHLSAKHIEACMKAIAGDREGKHLMTLRNFADIVGEVVPETTFEEKLQDPLLNQYKFNDDYVKCFTAMIEAEKFARIKEIKQMRENGKMQIGLLAMDLINELEDKIKAEIMKKWKITSEDSENLMGLAAE